VFILSASEAASFSLVTISSVSALGGVSWLFISYSGEAVAALPRRFVDDILLLVTLRFEAGLCERSPAVREPLPVRERLQIALEVEAVQKTQADMALPGYEQLRKS